MVPGSAASSAAAELCIPFGLLKLAHAIMPVRAGRPFPFGVPWSCKNNN
jgi:hypothetical protein